MDHARAFVCARSRDCIRAGCEDRHPERAKGHGGCEFDSVFRQRKDGRAGAELEPAVAWHQTIVTSYTKTIDYASRSSKEELTRTQMNPPDHGGEAPFVGEQKQVNMV